jgi:DNA ligase (NAD+)
MDMPGIARQTIKLLIDNKMLSCMDDLYRLRDREKELRKIDGMGAISTRVLLETIEKSRVCHMWRFLNGLGIPQVGKLIARKLDWYYKGDFFAFYTDAKEGKDFSHIKGVTDRDSDIIHRWCVTPHKAVNVERMMYYMTFITEDFDPEEMKQAHPTSPFYGKNVVLAGTYTKLSNEEITNQLMKAGAKVRAVIGSTTDFLLAGDHSGTKRARAAELGIPILYEDEFIRMIGDLT